MTNNSIKAANNAIKRKAAATPARAGGANSGLKGIVKQMEGRIKGALTGTALTPDRFTNVMLTTLSQNPKMMSCTTESFCAAMMQAAQLGLEPNTSLGQAYLIPYGKQCQFILGYKGLLQLAWNTKLFKRIDAQVVYENDEFDYELGLHQDLRHKPAPRDRGDAIGYYAVYEMKDGGNGIAYMSIDDMRKHAQRFSKSYNNGPWKSDFDAMAKKTVLKQLLKYAPVSAEVQKAAAADETIKEMNVNQDMEIDILDIPADEVEFEVEQPKPSEEAEIDLTPDPDDPFPEGQQSFT